MTTRLRPGAQHTRGAGWLRNALRRAHAVRPSSRPVGCAEIVEHRLRSSLRTLREISASRRLSAPFSSGSERLNTVVARKGTLQIQVISAAGLQQEQNLITQLFSRV